MANLNSQFTGENAADTLDNIHSNELIEVEFAGGLKAIFPMVKKFFSEGSDKDVAEKIKLYIRSSLFSFFDSQFSESIFVPGKPFRVPYQFIPSNPVSTDLSKYQNPQYLFKDTSSISSTWISRMNEKIEKKQSNAKNPGVKCSNIKLIRNDRGKMAEEFNNKLENKLEKHIEEMKRDEVGNNAEKAVFQKLQKLQEKFDF